MVEVDPSRIYEVLPMDSPIRRSAPKLKHSKSYAGGSVPKDFATYSVPRGANGTPPTTRAFPPAVPPRNRNMSEGEGHLSGGGGSLGSSPNDKGLILPPRGRAGITKSPSVSSISEELSLSDFISKYSQSLPHQVKVCKGFYGVSDQTAVTTGDLLNLHFLKNVKVVVIETGPQQGSTSYSVPLTSSIQFSPLFDPHDNLEEAKRGYWYNTVGEILALKTLPKIVRATKSFQGGNSDNSVAENELLLIKGVRSKLTGKQLRVHSLTSKKKKCLSESCAGHFTTAPDKLCMHLYEITLNLAEALPCKALISLFNSHDSVLNDLQGAVVTLKKAITEMSVIATSAGCDDGGGGSGEGMEVAEMPVNLDIEVEAVPLDEHDIDHLQMDTRYMYENFDPSSVCLYMTKATKRLYDIQCMLYTKLMTGNDFRGLDLIRPNNISHTHKHPTPRPPSLLPPPLPPLPTSLGGGSSSGGSSVSSTPSTVSSSSSSSAASSLGYQSLASPPSGKTGRAGGHTDYYVVMSPGATRAVSQEDTSDHSGDSVMTYRDQLAFLEAHNKNLETIVQKQAERCDRTDTLVEHLGKRVESLAIQLRMLAFNNGGVASKGSESSCNDSSVDRRPPAPLPDGVHQMEMLNGTYNEGKYHLIGGSMEGISPPEQSPVGVYSSAQDDARVMSNDAYLKTLNHQQVLNLLDVMGLKLYQESFKGEHMTGEILSECDEDVLTKDLGMSSKLHRMRLMKVISGRHSARNILHGEDPYLTTPAR